MRIDSHQHFWRYDPAEYPWIREEWPIRRDFLPVDLEPHLREGGLGGSIAVQARQSAEESRWLLELANKHSSVVGVVGWVELMHPRVTAELEALARHPKFVGVRHVVQDEPDERFMLRPEFLRGLGELQRFELAYDFLVFPNQLPATLEVARQFPAQRFILDHLAKPRVGVGELEPWAGLIRQLAECSNVHCKVSGLVTEAAWRKWRPEQFEPYLDVVFESFGPSRLMFGSDWPVCLLSGEYSQVKALVEDYVERHCPERKEAVFGLNAASFYRIGGTNLEVAGAGMGR